MSRSFRFVPPEPRPGVLPRPRLLRSLAGRWDHRITALTGGPGLGKTTLLAQAIAENRLAPRGDDVWIGVEPQDADADRLARVVSAALANGGEVDGAEARVDQAVVEPASVADAVWHRSPTEACLVLDDVHRLQPGSTGALWLAGLVDALPANGHIVLAGRSEPPMPLARLGAQGAVLWLAEDDLRFSDDELTGFAAERGLDPQRFGDTGGWPAMAELIASVRGSITGDFLWEEVLEPLGTMRRHVLAVLSDLGGGDDELASAAVGAPVELAAALDGVPLVARGRDGWFVPHSLWRRAPEIGLDRIERAEIRRRAVANLRERGRLDEAFTLIHEAELWDAAPAVLRAACLSNDRLEAGQLRRWLAMSTEAVRRTPAGLLASAIDTARSEPATAAELLQTAAKECRAAGDVDAELTALAQLGQLAWWRQDLRSLAELMERINDLEGTGHPKAAALAAFGRALVADLAGDDTTALAELASIETGALDLAWGALASWLYGEVRLNTGHPQAAIDVVERLARSADPAMRYVLDTLRLRACWAQGQVDEVIAGIPAIIEMSRHSGVTANRYIGLSISSLAYSHAGDVAAARRCLDESLLAAPPSRSGRLSVQSAAATASLQLADGDEAAATATLRDAIEAHGLSDAGDRRVWRYVIALSYVLLPETRSHWDALAARRQGRASTDLAAAVVAWRDGNSGPLRTVRVDDIGMVRAVLHHRLAAELAVGLASVGRDEGRALLEALGPPGRNAVRSLASNGSAQPAKVAKALLAAVPAPPPRPCYLAVLGPISVRRGGPDDDVLDVLDPELRRTRVQELLAYLVGRRRTTRRAVTAALWPDLDERSASNNLGVTITHLLRVLEPGRDSGDPPYLLRTDGQTLQLVTGPHLRVDVDDFEDHLAAAAQAEADGTPSVALEHHLAAVALYRDDLHLDLPEAEWFALDRERYRTRFVTTAVRAGQLLLGRGDHRRAQDIAHRALVVDPWSEDAYAVLVGAALARGDRSAAHRTLDRCLQALNDMGIQPSPTTAQLSRRIQTV